MYVCMYVCVCVSVRACGLNFMSQTFMSQPFIWYLPITNKWLNMQEPFFFCNNYIAFQF